MKDRMADVIRKQAGRPARRQAAPRACHGVGADGVRLRRGGAHAEQLLEHGNGKKPAEAR